MLGNCATGKLRIVMVPTITMTMEITMATMGRLMKNFDMGLPALSYCKGLGAHVRALPHFLNTFGDNSFPWVQPFSNNPLGTNAVADFDATDAHFVLAVHNRYLIAALQLGHRTLRN